MLLRRSKLSFACDDRRPNKFIIAQTIVLQLKSVDFFMHFLLPLFVNGELYRAWHRHQLPPHPHILMSEMAHAGEDHRHIALVGSVNRILIADRTTGLNDGGDAIFSGGFE